MSGWSIWDQYPKLVPILIQLHGQGLSFGQIAKQLGLGITRNAVIGKAGRLGLRCGKPSESRTYERASPKPMLIPPAPPIPQAPATMDGKPITLETVGNGQCRFPLWDDNEHNVFQVCGHSVKPSRAYCSYHAGICYQPLPKRWRKAQAEAA